MAANAFTLLGEARVTENGVEFAYFGDVPPEEKMGTAPGKIPKNAEDVIKMMHPDDVKSYVQNVEHSVASGAPFSMISHFGGILNPSLSFWAVVSCDQEVVCDGSAGRDVRWAVATLR
ncbi:MAG: hypothetical protein KA118_16000, partial [Verrucomicrobia bacterium]|nr:hypothetical protein [Verrucomicrobiota bacterium]